MSDAGPRSFGKYLLEREIARGGMARVHLATLRGLGGFEKRLVVKEILPELASDPRFVSMFVEEAKVLVALSHPNIVPVYELGIVDGTYFLAMEHVEGATLADLVADGALTPAEAARVGAEIADALAYAHERFDLVHRDVSPRNVMVDTAGHARLLDFGIAARADVGEGEGDALYGTPGFLSPEQARGEKLSRASDLFSLGCVLTYAVRGSSPFEGKDLEPLRALAAAPDVGMDDALGRVVRELLAPVPAARPASARVVARALGAAASTLEGDGESAFTTLAERATRQRARAPAARPETGPATGTVTPGRIETLAKSQALDAILGTSKLARDDATNTAPSNAEAEPAPGTARIERPRTVPTPAPGNRTPAMVLALIASVISAALVWNARFELAPTPSIDPIDHGLTSLADIEPLAIEPDDADILDARADVLDAALADASVPDAGVARARDAGPRGFGTLDVRSEPWAEISIDGRVIGNTPIRHYRIAAGSHDVHAENPNGHEDSRTIDVSPGETLNLGFNL